MSDSAKNIKSVVPSTKRCFTTRKALLEKLKNVLNAVEGAEKDRNTVVEGGKEGENPVIEVEEERLLAEGGYNYVWLVSFTTTEDKDSKGQPILRQVVFRVPKEEALLPYQIENEVAFLTCIPNYNTSIPVPKVYAYETGRSGSNAPFIAMEFINGEPLSSVWNTYTNAEKSIVAQEIANMVVDLGEIEFDGIGGLTPEYELGPTVEGMKLFKGRDRFHSPAYYDIGPYFSTHAYVLSCYDKEIHYYTHALTNDIDWDLFETTPKSTFIETLKSTRDTLQSSPSTFLPEEPFVLVHNDVHGRNIMMRDKHISAVLDWEFAGSYPLSELLSGGGVDVLEMETEADVEENWVLSDRIRDLVGATARMRRGWSEDRVGVLLGKGNAEFQAARVEMIPEDCCGEDEELEEVEGVVGGENGEA